jgi:hypothetical protein
MFNQFKVLQLIPINLQLFAEDDVDETSTDEDVVDSQDSIEDDVSLEDQTDGADNLDVADPEEGQAKAKQSHDENAIYQRLRVKAEKEAASKYEAEALRIAHEKQALEQMKTERRIMDDVLSPEKIWAKADEEGVTEDIASKLLLNEARTLIEVEKSKVRDRFTAIEQQKQALKSQKYFKELEAEVMAAVDANPNLDVQTAFYYLRGQKQDELAKGDYKSAEKRTVANMQDNMRRRTTAPGSAGSGTHIDPAKYMSKEELDMCRRFGNDPREVAKHIHTNQKRK